MTSFRKAALSLFTVLTAFTSMAQDSTVTFACSYTSNKINEKAICDLLGYRTRPEAQRAVEKIVSRSGLKQNFYVMECPNIDNCFAATRNGERLIVYDGSFMRRVNSLAKTDWGAMSVLAHEIGHHLQGHTLKYGGSDPERELEADEFSGFVMYQMGASLKEAQSAIWKLTTDYDTGSHPPRRKRLASIKTGYNKAKALYPRVNAEPETVKESQPEVREREIDRPKIEPVVVEKPEIKTPVKKVRTGCIEGNCGNGFGVAVNHRTYEKYAGNWKNGRRNGHGVEYYADGLKKFEGDFSGSSYHGYGTYFFKNGDRYVGKFKNNIMHDDQAIYYYRNGDRLFVRYVNGKKQGRAKIIYYGGVQGTVYFKDDVEL
ncbi:MORN repeat-containing protein [Jiulongibacter sp. NS-SX5]|uniref:MORN repeat-containing protein n=1 Tax=Jiulongibacter sp. NS-SX5 TaxID=3463854 RepID=UPI0040594706